MDIRSQCLVQTYRAPVVSLVPPYSPHIELDSCRHEPVCDTEITSHSLLDRRDAPRPTFSVCLLWNQSLPPELHPFLPYYWFLSSCQMAGKCFARWRTSRKSLVVFSRLGVDRRGETAADGKLTARPLVVHSDTTGTCRPWPYDVIPTKYDHQTDKRIRVDVCNFMSC